MKIEYDLINNKKIIRKKKIDFIIVLDNGHKIPYTLPDNVCDDIYEHIGAYSIMNDLNRAIIEDVVLESSTETEPIEEKMP